MSFLLEVDGDRDVKDAPANASALKGWVIDDDFPLAEGWMQLKFHLLYVLGDRFIWSGSPDEHCPLMAIRAAWVHSLHVLVVVPIAKPNLLLVCL